MAIKQFESHLFKNLILYNRFVPFSIIFDSSRRDNSEFVASSTISSRRVSRRSLSLSTRERHCGAVACRAAKRPGRPAMKRDFVALTHSASPLDEILTKNTYRFSIEFSSVLWFVEKRIVKINFTNIQFPKYRDLNLKREINFVRYSNSPISVIKYLKWKVCGVCISEKGK